MKQGNYELTCIEDGVFEVKYSGIYIGKLLDKDDAPYSSELITAVLPNGIVRSLLTMDRKFTLKYLAVALV